MERQFAPVSRVDSLRRTIQLNGLQIGRTGRVVGITNCERELKRRLLEMGFCNGARVEVVRRAPLGDPIEFRLRGYHLSLRADEASCIRIQPD